MQPIITVHVFAVFQLYGRRAPWEDPVDWVIETYPWTRDENDSDWPSLLKLRPEDVGYDMQVPLPGGGSTSVAAKTAPAQQNEAETDPLVSVWCISRGFICLIVQRLLIASDIKGKVLM